MVEFAVVVPLLVLVFLFALWFYELVYTKLKLQEATRYAAWETTSYPQHDYLEGKTGGLRLQMATQVSVEAMSRYSDLDSTRSVAASLMDLVQNPFDPDQWLNPDASIAAAFGQFQQLGAWAGLAPPANRVLTAAWAPPMIGIIDTPEEPIYGGTLINFAAMAGAGLWDMISARLFKHPNPVAQSLLRAGKGLGGARSDRFWGSDEWELNRFGYVRAAGMLQVRNAWFGAGVGRWLMPSFAAFLTDQHVLLGDAWQMYKPDEAVGTLRAPGYNAESRLWRQVDRMYFVNKKTRAVALQWTENFRRAMDLALMFTGVGLRKPEEQFFRLPAVTNRAYDSRESGKILIIDDDKMRKYDTAPLPPGSEYEGTLEQRGEYFMGCKSPMQLGCTDSLSQYEPWGSYIVREGN